MKKIKFTFLTFICLQFISLTFCYSQTSTRLIKGLPEGLSIGGYIDTYISYDNDKDATPRKFSIFAPNRDEFRLNIARLTAKYDSKIVRGTVSIHYGDMPKGSWPADNQFIQEANLGFSPTKNFWIDAGYFITHIGLEGMNARLNLFQTVSLCSYYQPIVQSGIKISYEKGKFYGSLYLLNGYNVFTDNNKNKSIGMTLGYKPNDKLEFTYNNIIGNEMPSSAEGKTRFYNDVVIKYNPTKKIEIILCNDLCYQEKSKIIDTEGSALMFAGFASFRYKPLKKFSTSIRAEYFQDKEGFMSGIFTDSDGNLTGLKSYGFTYGVEFNPTEESYFRLKSRYLVADSKQKIFYDSKNSRIEVILSGGIEF